MEMNLVGEYYKTPDDLFREIMRMPRIKYNLFHQHGTKQAVILDHPIHGKPNTNCNGFYVIFNHNVPVYVGQTSGKNTIHRRLSRFVKTLLGNNTERENHPAADEFMKIHGNSLAGLSVMIFPVLGEFIREIDVEKVETRLIQEFKPRFNKSGTTFRRRSTCYKDTNKKCDAAIITAIKEETVQIASLEKFLF